MNTTKTHPTRCVLRVDLNADGGVLLDEAVERLLPGAARIQRGDKPVVELGCQWITSLSTARRESNCG